MVSSHGPGNMSTFCPHKLRDTSLGISGYFYLPFALVLHYLQLDTAGILRFSRAITNELAVYYRSQSDYLDLYGTRAQNGKEERDIQGNKCSWLIVEGGVQLLSLYFSGSLIPSTYLMQVYFPNRV